MFRELRKIPKQGLRSYSKWQLVFGGMFAALLWFVYLPVQPYRAYCGPISVDRPLTYLGPSLPDPYIDGLVRHLASEGVPHILIGSRVFVPILARGVLDDRIGPVERAFFTLWFILKGRTAHTWKNINEHVTMSLANDELLQMRKPELVSLLDELTNLRSSGAKYYLIRNQITDIKCQINRTLLSQKD